MARLRLKVHERVTQPDEELGRTTAVTALVERSTVSKSDGELVLIKDGEPSRPRHAYLPEARQPVASRLIDGTHPAIPVLHRVSEQLIDRCLQKGDGRKDAAGHVRAVAHNDGMGNFPRVRVGAL